MNIVVTGSLGHIGMPLTQELLKQGHHVIVITSSPSRQKEIEHLGATAALGSIEDSAFLTETFTGADAVYTMIPPNNYSDQSLDLTAYVTNAAGNIANAVIQAGVKRLVHLSSIGAHLAEGNGIIAAHHVAEGIISQVKGVAITFVRPTAFHYNLYSYIPAVKYTGAIAANYGADDKIAWVAPQDIATVIADELNTSQECNKVRYVASDELTCNEVAAILGEAIGQPDLQWNLIPSDQVQRNLISYGLNPEIAAGLVAMQDAMHSGIFFEDYYHNRPTVMGSVKMTDFARDFAAAYHAPAEA